MAPEMTSSRVKRLIATGTLALGVAAAGLVAPTGAREASAHYKIPNGGVDLTGHCRALYGPTARAVLVRPDAYGWRCAWESPLGVRRLSDISINDACVRQYRGRLLYAPGTSTAPLPSDLIWAQYRSYSDPYSWECWHHRDGHPALLQVTS